MSVRVGQSKSQVHLPDRRVFVAMLPSVALGLAGCASMPMQAGRMETAPTRKVARYETRERPGTIVIDPPNHYLYLVQGGGNAVQYGVGVGKEGFGWSGVATVHDKQEWPDWYPPKEMLARKPDILPHMTELRGGLGMRGGPDNPLGARALYLWQGHADTLYRIHGTNEPWTIGQNVSSGCIRLTNQDIVDLYDQTPIGTKVVVLSAPAA